ncbi:MAG: hypothetical protein H6728_00795 [Myxococcales bacterium]|nr:hypothetical protein [Myxococcales bacterium]
MPMFRCEDCQQMTAPGVPQNRVVIAMRRCLYPILRTSEFSSLPKSALKDLPDPEGWEIARELKLCASCAASHQPDASGVSSRAKMLSGEKRVPPVRHHP